LKYSTMQYQLYSPEKIHDSAEIAEMR